MSRRGHRTAAAAGYMHHAAGGFVTKLDLRRRRRRRAYDSTRGGMDDAWSPPVAGRVRRSRSVRQKPPHLAGGDWRRGMQAPFLERKHFASCSRRGREFCGPLSHATDRRHARRRLPACPSALQEAGRRGPTVAARALARAGRQRAHCSARRPDRIVLNLYTYGVRRAKGDARTHATTHADRRPRSVAWMDPSPPPAVGPPASFRRAEAPPRTLCRASRARTSTCISPAASTLSARDR